MVTTILKVDNVDTVCYYDQWLYNKITKKWLHTIRRDDDRVIVIDGGEGSGKSVLAFQIAKLLTPKFDIDSICMNANEFKKVVKEARPGDCVVYDEAFTGLSSKGALSEINKILVELMMEMRQKNLKVIIVLPTFFMLEKYVALFRASCLFHVYRKQGRRGHWMYFGKKKKKLLYILGKKLLSYKEPKSERLGKFTNVYTINEQAYRDKKMDAFKNKDRKGRNEKYKAQRDIAFWYLIQKLGITQEVLTDMMYLFGFEVDQSNLSKDFKSIENKIKSEIENPPDDEFINRLVKMINLRNEPKKKQDRMLELERRAKSELRREMNRLKKEKAKKKSKKTKKSANTPENKASETIISKNIQENDSFEAFIEEI